ncbi:kinase-like protein [Favolaschia claudopus]|uniref:Kinase-like protein n=1 Tax=Favolaschia claudopus TaxID=2862362 RepID=A0AAW0AHI4_9AGAR
MWDYMVTEQDEPIQESSLAFKIVTSETLPDRATSAARDQRREQIIVPDDGDSDNNIDASSLNADLDRTAVPGYFAALLTSWKCRQRLLMLPDAERNSQVHHQLKQVETEIMTFYTNIFDCEDAGFVAQQLEESHAQVFIDATQDVLHWGTLPNATSRRKARQLMQDLSEAREKLSLPASLFIEGVNDPDEYPTFHGGFGDVFQASYKNKTVALKRIRVFEANPTANRRHRLGVYKEALVWQGLRHKFILPLLGIDRTTFAPALCMVSPWMKHGTVLKYLNDRGHGDVDRLLLEIAQGLEYLHSVDVIHGDLRGSNILISDEGNACLSDFGLATMIPDTDSTIAMLSSSSSHAGSVRWFAPELIRPTSFGLERFLRTTASDVYAYALVCIELYTNEPPFSHLIDSAVLLGVIDGMRPGRPSSMSTPLFEMVTSAWAGDFHIRPNSREVVCTLHGMGVVSSAYDYSTHYSTA